MSKEFNQHLSLYRPQYLLCGYFLSEDNLEHNPLIMEHNQGYVIDINAPGSDGVSYNIYDRFDVDRPTILNNSAKESKNTILGDIEGNANLQQGSEAKVILNQIIGRHRTAIGQTIEVAGSKADVVIANVYGISVEYGDTKFINTNSVTLVTGRALFDDKKELTGYSVNPSVSRHRVLRTYKYRDPDVNLNIVGNYISLSGLNVRNLKVVVGVDRVDAQLNPILAPVSSWSQNVRPILGIRESNVAETLAIDGVGLANINFNDNITAKNLLVRNVRQVINRQNLSISDNIEIYNVDSFRNQQTINAKNFSFKGNNLISEAKSTLNVKEDIDIAITDGLRIEGELKANNISMNSDKRIYILDSGKINANKVTFTSSAGISLLGEITAKNTYLSSIRGNIELAESSIINTDILEMKVNDGYSIERSGKIHAKEDRSPGSKASDAHTVIKEHNGGYVVEINEAGDDGVSQNTYDRFDVEKTTLFNNSSKASQNTSLGEIAGNTKIKPGREANVILNQVVGEYSSSINAPMEVVGRRADVVIANPNGIKVTNNAKFININNVSFIVGRAFFNDKKELAGYDIESVDKTNILYMYKNREPLLELLGFHAPDINLNLVANRITTQGSLKVKNLSVNLGVDRVNTDLKTLSTGRFQTEIKSSRFDGTLDVAEDIAIEGNNNADIDIYADITAKNLKLSNIRHVFSGAHSNPGKRNTLAIGHHMDMHNIGRFINRDSIINANNFTFSGGDFRTEDFSQIEIKEDIDITANNSVDIAGDFNANNINIISKGTAGINYMGKVKANSDINITSSGLMRVQGKITAKNTQLFSRGGNIHLSIYSVINTDTLKMTVNDGYRINRLGRINVSNDTADIAFRKSVEHFEALMLNVAKVARDTPFSSNESFTERSNDGFIEPRKDSVSQSDNIKVISNDLADPNGFGKMNIKAISNNNNVRITSNGNLVLNNDKTAENTDSLVEEAL